MFRICDLGFVPRQFLPPHNLLPPSARGYGSGGQAYPPMYFKRYTGFGPFVNLPPSAGKHLQPLSFVKERGAPGKGMILTCKICRYDEDRVQVIFKLNFTHNLITFLLPTSKTTCAPEIAAAGRQFRCSRHFHRIIKPVTWDLNRDTKTGCLGEDSAQKQVCGTGYFTRQKRREHRHRQLLPGAAIELTSVAWHGRVVL